MLTSFAGVGLAADPVHGDGQSLMGLKGDAAEAHGTWKVSLNHESTWFLRKNKITGPTDQTLTHVSTYVARFIQTVEINKFCVSPSLAKLIVEGHKAPKT